MAETATPPAAAGAPLDDAQWAKVLAALPDAAAAANAAEIRPKFVVLDVAAATDLPADGMYVVLDGAVSLLSRDDPLATAKPGDYFYEEHLELRGLPVSLTARAGAGARVAFLSVSAWFDLPDATRTAFFSTLFGDLVTVQMQTFQQPINCCSVTAAALGMSVLGFPCEVNDIFRKVNLPSHYVVNTGISLGELFDIACTYIHTIGLRDTVQVQAYFMDRAVTSAALLRDAIMESARVGGADDILVANFQVGLAHGDPTMPGGHFAVIAKCNPSTGLLHMMDVHPEKYGKMWVTTVDRLYAAMSDRDGGSMRARGFLRFSAREAVSTELETLAQPCRYLDSTRHLDISNEKRREMFRRATPNLNGLSVLAESFEIFGDHWANEDKLLRSTTVSYADSLRTARSAAQLAEIARQYLVRFPELHLEVEHRAFDLGAGGTDPETWFASQLRHLNEHEARHLLINIDLNAVLGHEAVATPDSRYVETALLKEFWCICIGYDAATDRVTLVDMSPATSQVWQAPRSHVFRGLRDSANPAMVVLQKSEVPPDPADVARLIRENPLILFHAADDPWSQMLRTLLANIGATALVEQDISGPGSTAARIRRQLVAHTGNPSPPYLFLKGEYQGQRPDVVDAILAGELQARIRDAGLPALPVQDTPSLDHNPFGYPKGGLTAPRDGKRNVLLCACGSSAADKVPELVEKLVAAGHHVKLAPSPRAEHFFKDFGADRILRNIKHSDFYRDSDEWNFRYTEFGMPVRASHLALCDWADCVIVAPVTCNTMAKIANGIGDSLITSVFVAWQYQRKPVILAPACNTNMWNNLTTQANVARLKRLGATFAGPRWDVLSNGFRGVGAMARPDDILAALDVAFEDLDHQDHRVVRWAQEAALSEDPSLWDRIFRTIREDVVGVNIIDEETGDGLLHYAAGGAGEVHGTGRKRGVAHLSAARELISLGVDVNLLNANGFSAMHVAMMNQAEDVVRLLLDQPEFNVVSCLRLLSEVQLSEETCDRLIDWSKKFNVDNPDADHDAADDVDEENDTKYLYFTYGSLKQGFPNHERFKDTLNDFVGVAQTRQALPLIVQKLPACDNDACDYLHRMATLVDRKGDGKHVLGEAYRVTARGLKKLDALEGYHGPNAPTNTYVRKKISIVVNGQTTQAFCYFAAKPQKYIESLELGESEIVAEYSHDMAVGPLKPGRKPVDAAV